MKNLYVVQSNTCNNSVEDAEFLEQIIKDEYYDVLSTEDCFDYEVANNIILGYN